MTASGDFYSALIRAYDLAGSHPRHHPSVRVALAEAGTKLEGCRPAEAEVGKSGLRVGGSQLLEGGAGPSALARALLSAGVSRVRFCADAEAETVEALVWAVRASESRVPAEGAALRSLEARGLELSFGAVADSTVRDAPRPVVPGTSAGPDPLVPSGQEALKAVATSGPEGAAAREASVAVEDPRLRRAAAALFGEAPSRERDDGGSPGPTFDERIKDGGLEEAVEAYAILPDERLEGIIFETVAALRTDRELDGAVAALEVLVHGADAGAEDPRVALARRLGRTEVRDHLVRQLAVCGPERLDRLTRVAVALGSVMGPPLGQALTESSDRTHRERFLRVLSTMGPDALEAVEDLIGDARWFVVRNGVHLLAEVAGGRAVEHLSRSLGHHDPRVRSEAARGLARVGGDRAVRLLLGALDDPDQAVRSVTAEGLGLIGGRQVVPALLDRLGVESRDAVQVALIESLGQIGDARAVPTLRRRATAGSFVAGATDVRLAAFRALWAIGSPEARTVVMQALEDRDPDVRGVVRTLLGGH